MAGVGKIGLAILLLALCVPAAARLSRRAGLAGQPFNLPGWLLRVCHHGSVPRGTQRRSPQAPAEPVNALRAQDKSDSSSAVPLAGMIIERAALPGLRLLITGGDPPCLSLRAFLCTFLI